MWRVTSPLTDGTQRVYPRIRRILQARIAAELEDPDLTFAPRVRLWGYTRGLPTSLG